MSKGADGLRLAGQRQAPHTHISSLTWSSAVRVGTFTSRGVGAGSGSSRLRLGLAAEQRVVVASAGLGSWPRQGGLRATGGAAGQQCPGLPEAAAARHWRWRTGGWCAWPVSGAGDDVTGKRSGWHGGSLLGVSGPARAPDPVPHGGSSGRDRRPGCAPGGGGMLGASWSPRWCARLVRLPAVGRQLTSSAGWYRRWFHHHQRPGESPDAMAHTTTHINRPARPDVAAPPPGAAPVARAGRPGLAPRRVSTAARGLPRPGGVSRAGAGGLAGVAGSA